MSLLAPPTRAGIKPGTSMSKKFVKYFLLYLVPLLLLAYLAAWYDLVMNGEVDGSSPLNWIQMIPRSISYMVGWVLPYWWLFMLICALALAALSTVLATRTKS